MRVEAFKHGLLMLLMTIALSSHAATQPGDAALDAQVIRITSNLRCLVCQNQSIAESTADLANDLRRQVREQLQAGKTDKEIVDFMVTRYGDFVLYDPPLKAITLLLWMGPFALMVLAIGSFAWTSQQRKKQPSARLNDTDRARAKELLNTHDDASEVHS
ncbi:MAG TPA: cytochrome c-type biogenesis protein [Rhodocyclaceae bacterium]|nr:cytochrome c-type biogenesis protein [Rhodocyclaceae bacterium]